MTTKKIYSPWIKWHGGECPVPRDLNAMVKLRYGSVRGPGRAVSYQWGHYGDDDGEYDIVEYRIITEHTDLGAAEQLLCANGYTVIPPTKPLTFEDVEPMTEIPPKGTEFWVVSPAFSEGVFGVPFSNDKVDSMIIKRRMAYLDKEDALIAARHIFGLKGGEL